MVQQRTVLHLSLQSHISRLTGIRLNASQIRLLDKEKLAHLLKQTQDQQTPHIFLELYHDYSHAIEKLEKQVLQQVKDMPGYRLLTSVPGIGKILALTILLETGDINRFPKVGNYASYARCVNSQRISNGKNKGQNNRKNGNRYLAWAFMEAAHFAAIWSPPIKQYYQSKKDKKHVMVAKKAVANKLARACYHMLKQQTPFEISKAFG